MSDAARCRATGVNVDFGGFVHGMVASAGYRVSLPIAEPEPPWHRVAAAVDASRLIAHGGVEGRSSIVWWQ